MDIKRQDITLQDWTKGISADEFAWGSYFYADWISSGYNTKGFELWYRLSKTALNNRAKGYVTALSPTWWYWFTAFTRDWRIEMEEMYNWNKKWAYYAFEAWGGIGNWYLNWISYWNYFFWIRETSVDKVDKSDLFDESNQLLSNTDLSDATWWTLGTWWTTTDNWAEHSTGTDPLTSDTVSGSYSVSDRFRVAVKITNWTAGSITVKWWASNTETFSEHKDWWYVSILPWAASMYVEFTPSNTFDWTIEEATLLQLDTSKLDNVSIYWGTTSEKHPALVWEGDLYVGCWSVVNIINISTFTNTYKSLVDSDFEIVAMNQQAGNIIIWATNWYDSRQYYWNWVDAVATEVIEWKWLIIQSAAGTETITYVLTTSWANSWAVEWYEYRLYAVSGYQRNLIASKLYMYGSGNYLETAHYNENKKFDFNDVTDDHWMIIFLDSLYIPWCDGIYKYGYDIPWIRSSWTRPIKYDTWSTNIIMGQRGHFLGVAFRSDWVNYIGNVDNRLYTSQGYLVTESIYWDRLSTRKALAQLKIWYKNLASTIWGIKVYAIVDDTYFWRFRPTSTPTTRPTVWAIYEVAHNTTAKVIAVDTTNWVITLVTESNTWAYPWLANTTLIKVSWTWDDTISVGYNYDNMCLIKTIESDKQSYGSDFIFWKDFVNNYLPYWHKLQLVVELNSNNLYLSPEIYEISMVSDITDTVL